MNIWKTAASCHLLFEPQIRQNPITYVTCLALHFIPWCLSLDQELAEEKRKLIPMLVQCLSPEILGQLM